MDKLQANETVLTGSWVACDGQVQGDTNCKRIEWLISNTLRKITDSPVSGGWETLYQDTDDNRYWERTYPQGELHGGGPAELRYLAAREASAKYGVSL
jgi:hypothetical protein